MIVGLGAVGRRLVRYLAEDKTFESIVVVHRDPERVRDLVADLGDRVEVRGGSADKLPPADVTLIAGPNGPRGAVAAALTHGSHVVCAIDGPAEVRAVLGVDSEAKARDLTVAVGTAMAPGLSCVLAAQMARGFDRIDEIHVASLGTGGPACARRHHSALTSIAVDWEDGVWRRRPGGSGRELVWFPEPVGGADCYRASVADPLLLVPAFPQARRVTSRLEATRRDRLTSWLPMLRAPHPEGLVGAVRVEMRGWVDGRAETGILGSAVTPSEAAAAVSATAARWILTGEINLRGAAGLAQLVSSPGRFLRELSGLGVPVSEFAGQGYLEKGTDGSA